MANGLFNLKQVMQAVQQSAWVAQKPPAVEYLVVAGGGGGGYAAGGAGAGGLLQGIDPVPNGQTLIVTVGGGGAGGTGGAVGASGTNSVFGAISATGGGAGGSYPSTAGASGGSGGGAETIGGNILSGTIGQGIVGQGNAGGLSWAGSQFQGGGGGGAGTVGFNAIPVDGSFAGNGGAGVASAISGTVTTYAGGGGGAGDSGGTAANGGVGGGGAGGASRGSSGGTGTVNGGNGTANTGGGAGSYGVGGTGGTGGTGIVIVSYPDTYAAATTVNATASTSGSGSVLFNGSTQYISTSSVTIGTGNFTFETWSYIVSNGANYGRIFGLGDLNSSTGLSLSLNPSTMRLEVNNTAGIILNPAQTYSFNTWYHFALVRSASTLTLYVNGVSQGVVTLVSSLSGSIYVSAVNYLGSIFYGASYTSNYRVTTNAVYTSNFTPSTIPLTSISGTILLLNTVSGAPFADNSGTYTPTAFASPTWNQLSPFTGTGYKNRVYTWTSSGTITF